MSLLDKLGLGQKKKEGVPVIGEQKKKEEHEAELKRNNIYRAITFISFLLIVILFLPENTYQPVANYTVGEPWRSDDLTAPFTFSLKKTDTELEEESEAIREQTPLIFHLNSDAYETVEEDLESFEDQLQPILDSYLQWQRSDQAEESSARNDSIRFKEELGYVDFYLDDNAWNTILENHKNIYLEGDPVSESLVSDIRNEVQVVINRLYNEGVIDLPKEEIEPDELTIRNLEERTERTVGISSVRDRSEAFEFTEDQLTDTFDEEIAHAAQEVLKQVLIPNWTYSEEDSETYLTERLSSLSQTKGAIAQDEVIIRRGDIVTQEQDNILKSLAQARASTASEVERWLRFSGDVVIISLAAFVFFMYIRLYRRPIYDNPAMFLLVFITLMIVCVASAFIYPFDNVNNYIVPVAIAPIILTIIFDSRVGLLSIFTLAIITALINDNSFEYLVATIVACSLGIFSVRDIKKRSQFFFTTPLVVFGSYVAIVGAFALARYSGWENFTNDLFYLAINSVFILFTYPLILLFEKSFKITTDFTLLEMGDTNQPLLKELMNKAPGTFHHSLQVANLSESAASAIGANALLCRVGAMYHDIGKMIKPNYFIENQSDGNEHDKLKAKMSALIIKAHVSDGVKKAKKYNLPELIVDFIRTHHGTSLIRFFYDKAQTSSEKEIEIPEEDFRYDGPIPFTKEQGILLLADGVEAASRAMKDPTYNKLENLINRMIDDHISDGQLSNCPLTFRHIQIIKESFLTILVGVYHSRVEYPEEKKKKKKSGDHKKEPSSGDAQQQKNNGTSTEAEVQKDEKEKD
ncbi:MAG: HDIG domain-containing metalloprotein [Balneolaceae bacterium]